jgi:hypothetical protein
MPSGTIRKVQGYEGFALKELVKVYPEEDIKTYRRDIPSIPYYDDGKKRVYHPDIWLPNENKLIEVKSLQTYIWHKNEVLLKKKAAQEQGKEQGFSYEIWCFDAKGNRIEEPV